MDKITTFTPRQSLFAGFLLSTLNPKNIALIIAVAAILAQSTLTIPHQIIALAVFTLAASLGIATPLLIYSAAGDRSTLLLDRLKNWMQRYSNAILAALLLLIGILLLRYHPRGP